MCQLQQYSLQNRLLTALTVEDFVHLAPHLEVVPLSIGQILIAADQPITHAVFVEEGLVSLTADTREGRVEIGLVGYEGMSGTPLLLGTERTPQTVMVQAEGTALRIEAAVLGVALDASPLLRGVLGRYVQSLIIQVGQTAYAAVAYQVQARTARRILMIDDRLQRDEIPLTHDHMSKMLSVRRPSVTVALQNLEAAQAIRAKRGRITVLDRAKLIELASGAYGTAEAEYERLLSEGGSRPTFV